MNKIHYHITLPRLTYSRVKRMVRGWSDLVSLQDAIINATPPAPEVPGRSGKISDPAGKTAIALEEVTRKLDAIEHSIKSIDEYFAKGVWNNAVRGSPFPSYANIKTWQEYKRDFFYMIAVELKLPLKE